MVGCIGSITLLVSDRESTILAPGSDRPVFGNFTVDEVQIIGDLDLFSCRHLDRIQLLVTVSEGISDAVANSDTILHRLVEIFALLSHASRVPSPTGDDDFLGNI